MYADSEVHTQEKVQRLALRCGRALILSNSNHLNPSATEGQHHEEDDANNDRVKLEPHFRVNKTVFKYVDRGV
jgi:hypothetical protein